MQSHVSYLT